MEDKYINTDEYVYCAVSKTDGSKFYDVDNRGGFLTSYIRNVLGIEVPNLYFRKKYLKENGKQWWEQFFDIIKEEKANTKKCPYCEWETVDVENRSGAFTVHLMNAHGITVEEHLKKYPEDSEYLSKQTAIIEKKRKLEKVDNYIVCPICHEKFEKITYWHLKNRHNITFDEFLSKYPDHKVLSDHMHNQTIQAQALTNLTVSKDRFISKYEKEIREFLDKHNIQYEANRQILIGKEIDILIPSMKIGIEFDGLKWHTEFFGKKNHKYHLEKTLKCNEQGYKLIHIFEDEYVNKKDIVYSKLKHILGIEDNEKVRAYGRKCSVKAIYKYDAENFLNKYHIQGFASSTVYLGALFNEELVAVMCFKNGNIKNTGWELTRFATNDKYNCVGVGGKMFKYFVREYNPELVYSFADRRWTTDINDNLYTKIGFKLDKICPPDYKYYNELVNKYERIHKMSFSKSKLSKKYGFPNTMTEIEMARELKYDRIWDCGLLKYVYKP